MKIENFMKIGKAIVVEGTKAVTITAGVTVITTLANGGVEALKEIDLDKLLNNK